MIAIRAGGTQIWKVLLIRSKVKLCSKFDDEVSVCVKRKMESMGRVQQFYSNIS